MRKKLLASILAIMMVLTLSAPALAAESTVTVSSAAELKSAIASNTTIVLKAGTYTYEDGLFINDVSGLTLRGEGDVIIKSSNVEELEAAFVLFIGDCQNVTLENLTLEFVANDVFKESTACLGMHGSTVTLRNCALTGPNKDGLSAGLSTITAENCQITAYQNPLTLYLSSIDFTGCTLTIEGPGYAFPRQKMLYFHDNVENGKTTKTYTFTDCTFNGDISGGISNASFAPDNADAYISVKTTQGGGDNTGAGPLPFTDVKEGDWFYDSVAYVVERELFAGTSATTFEPNTKMNRAMLVTVLHRLAGKPEVTATVTFSDVPGGSYYEDAVAWAAANEIVGGIGGGQFGGTQNITREQVVTILYRYAESAGIQVDGSADISSYADAGRVSNFATVAVKWAVDAKILTGRADGTLDPQGTATRAEIAAIISRFCDL